MRDVTDTVMRYRLVLQSLWNAHCWANPDLRTTDVMHSFEALKQPLFKFFVWDDIDPGWQVSSTIFGGNFRVVPPLTAPLGGKSLIHSLLVNMAPLHEPGGLWSPLSGKFDADDLDIHLIEFFDWRLFYWRDYRYFRVRIDGFKSHPVLIGRDALVDVSEVSVLFRLEAGAIG